MFSNSFLNDFSTVSSTWLLQMFLNVVSKLFLCGFSMVSLWCPQGFLRPVVSQPFVGDASAVPQRVSFELSVFFQSPLNEMWRKCSNTY